MTIEFAELSIWFIAAVTVAAMIVRPFHTPEWPWSLLGAFFLLLLGLISPTEAFSTFLKGADVYLFLIGMMLMSEFAREEGVFRWIADMISKKSYGSPQRLFFLVYIIGTVVTIFMSNDATAVVLTPAVYQVVKRSGVIHRPYLFACAFIANTASFVLPISNPANLVVYRENLPGLFKWIQIFILPSLVAIVTTYFVLRYYFRKDLQNSFISEVFSTDAKLSDGGLMALCALCVGTLLLLVSSYFEIRLGLPTFVIATGVIGIECLRKGVRPLQTFRQIAWGVIPLVGGLFVIVEGLNKTQFLARTQEFFVYCSSLPIFLGEIVAAFGIALLSNVANNLPVGLLTGAALQQGADFSPSIMNAALIGVDLGPNLSVTGSLATILWMMALRREGESMSAREFLKIGVFVMPVSLFCAIFVLAIF